MNQLPAPFNILSPKKKLSQLIAKSWLDGNRIPLDDKKFLIENDLLSEQEASYYKIEVEEKPEEPPNNIRINAVSGKISIHYPQRPDGITDKALEDWINSPSDSEPWMPKDEDLSSRLPRVEEIIGQ